MELKSSCHTMRQFECILKELVKNDMGRVLKKENIKYQVDTAKEWAIVYQVYVGQFGDYAVNVRFWYDTERDYASIKISQEVVDRLQEEINKTSEFEEEIPDSVLHKLLVYNRVFGLELR